MKTITPLRHWMRIADPHEQELLARRVGTTRGMLHQYAGGHRRASALTAGKIEAETTLLNKASRGRLPIIYRTDLAEACLTCQYARKCLGARATVSEFPIVDERQLELPV